METLILSILVDDGFIPSNSLIKTNTFPQGVEQHFQMTQCNLNYFLGMEITRCTDGSDYLHRTNKLQPSRVIVM